MWLRSFGSKELQGGESLNISENDFTYVKHLLLTMTELNFLSWVNMGK